jgi:hypothetical protein
MNVALRILVIMLAALSAAQGTLAQEQLVPLTFNPGAKHAETPVAVLRSPVSLPFTDDFSYLSSAPDPALWTDRQVFVNTTFPLNPPSIGVATFDGLNEFGHPYDSTSFNLNSIGGADTLTSQPILLGALSPASNVYLSFYFQPGGLGDKPNDSLFNSFNYSKEFGDSLILEFKDVNGTWQHAWATDGLPGNQGYAAERFYQEILKVNDASFFHDDFQFRFRNIASRIGQYDCWNIDYVKLGAGRTPGDTILSDVAIQYLPSSILKNYESMPWNQFENFQSQEKAASIILTVQNNFNIGKNTSRQMTAEETTTGTFIFDSGLSSENFDAGESRVLSFSNFNIPDFSGDSIVIATSFAISATGGSGVASNDSVTRYQIFHNEMAYDDGTPEAVYRLLGSPASIALRFHVNTPDTLRAVKIMFAHSEVNMATSLFNLLVWNSVHQGTNNADTLLRDEFLLPDFSDERNGFIYYRLSRPVPVTDTFYIGWFQVSLQTDLKIDVGFDKNDTASQHLFYNITGEWIPSELPGAIMMRPVLGKEIPFQVGVSPVRSAAETVVFPNPASDVVYVRGITPLKLEVTDYSGKKLITSQRQPFVDVRELPSGFYFLLVTDEKTGKTSRHKFIKTH